MLVTGASVSAELSPLSRGVPPVFPAGATATASSTSCSAYVPVKVHAELQGNIAVKTVRAESSESQLTSDNTGSYQCVRTG